MLPFKLGASTGEYTIDSQYNDVWQVYLVTTLWLLIKTSIEKINGIITSGSTLSLAV